MSIVTAMDAYATQLERPWWVTEIGFKATPGSYVEPWKWPGEVGATALPVDEEAQARGYRAWFSALSSAKTVDTVLFWMVPSDLNDLNHPWAFEPRQGFSFVNKQAEHDIRSFAPTWRARRPTQSLSRVARKKTNAPTAKTTTENKPISAPQTK